MDAVTEPITEAAPRKRRFGVTPAVEVGVLVVAVAIAGLTYAMAIGRDSSEQLLAPPTIALLLVANLISCGSLIVLLGRRVAKRHASRSASGGDGRLHVRLVAIFSVLASVPTVLLAVIASLLFQYAAEFWFSDRNRGILENSQRLAQESYAQLLSYVDNENVAMANDVRRMLFEYRWEPDSKEFYGTLAQGVYQRSLSNAVLFSVDAKGQIQTLAIVKNSDRNPMQDIEFNDIKKMQAGAPSVVGTNAQRTYSLARVEGTELYLYATREVGAKEMADRVERVRTVLTDYQTLLSRTRAFQVQFNIALLVISLFVIGVVVFIALAVADRLVRPVNELVGAARKVAAGDLKARVPERKTRDEIGVLAGAFNQMTSQLQAQTNALVTANAQLESRRALIEAVMSGVSAGVVSIGSDRTVRLMNASALALLRCDEVDSVGKPLGVIAPELEALLDAPEREAVVQVTVGGEARTLAVKITSDEAGQVLTFDDITQQLLDQRRAAWSDVARRIAHEIKNPLTPIQLAAERLQRRYGKQIEGGEGVFSQLTGTIVRQVGDLRRMVDEFSSFARMPKPLFRRESLLDMARQAMFLHEVAHPTIRFELDVPDEPPSLVSDRRQMGQALTNVIKNAVEAIEARGEGEALPQGEVVLTIRQQNPQHILLTIADNGIGLPVERDRIVEPYMTTRSRGTGLGLAIVKKIVEEHCGTIGFSDRAGGGTVVSIGFDTDALDKLAQQNSDGEAAEPRAPALTRTGKSS
ncbi:ATP-binding protein [Sphingomonas sp. HF-S4]|uniref:histidine kinase n=1 Tax=Sphingomonas agrestis TaxID=3080540 RepID=A0ABU3Y529_9SPHN|nr:ATP-binding protein [Sphingomonas sp. HF-S4]MDV3456478.1 ATP-binding protein [Sphingomonas sp. HF-S4]